VAENGEAARETADIGTEDVAAIIERTSENIARLGNDLTPMGSIRAGNEEGTIPAWEGGLTRDDWPAGYPAR
jgi:hypothetical protein